LSTTKHLDTHYPNTLANGCGKRVQYTYGRGDPFCESVVAILGLVECRRSSKDSENGLGRVAGLKARKERVRG
jgi:hypothetical protein